jgi:hypothetical protein
MKVLVIRQPWAWLIVNGYKDIENRPWNTHYRGPILIQASSHRPTKKEKVAFTRYARRRGVELPETFDLGGIVGRATLEDCVTSSRSKWFVGPVGLVLSKPKKLPFVPLKGRLMLFDPPKSVLKRLGLSR